MTKMTLKGMGFDSNEVGTCMRLTLEGDHKKTGRLAMLNRIRGKTRWMKFILKIGRL